MANSGAPARVLVIDNIDSFVYNLVQYVGELGAEPIVVRNNEVTVEEGNGVFAFGGAQLVLKNGNSYIAGSDPRKDGHAVAF